MFPAPLLMVFTFLNVFALLVTNHLADFNARNKSLTAKHLQLVVDIINFKGFFPNFIIDTLN